MKKLLLILGTITASVTPLLVVACGGESQNENSDQNINVDSSEQNTKVGNVKGESFSKIKEELFNGMKGVNSRQAELNKLIDEINFWSEKWEEASHSSGGHMEFPSYADRQRVLAHNRQAGITGAAAMALDLQASSPHWVAGSGTSSLAERYKAEVMSKRELVNVKIPIYNAFLFSLKEEIKKYEAAGGTLFENIKNFKDAKYKELI